MTDPTERLTTSLAGRDRIERELGAGGMATSRGARAALTSLPPWLPDLRIPAEYRRQS